MSSAKTLGVRHPRGFPDTAESDYIPSETSRLSESSQDLIHACEVFFETDVMALYGCPELIHYEVTVPEHTLPFSVLVSTRSEITKSEPDPRHNSHEIELAYAERIGQLEHEGLAEGIELNENSEKDFWRFINTLDITSQAELVFIGEGNLRAIWEDEIGNFLGLHFLGNRSIIYVIFKKHPDGKGKTTDTDMVSFRETINRIYQHGLEFLVNV